MYAYFKGKVDRIYVDKISLDVGDIGYEIYMPENETSVLEEGKKVKIYTYLHVREDDMKLFGFLNNETLIFFKKLISVSGVGSKVALGIISNISSNDMCMAIATDDVSTLKSIPGIGPKMAQKIIFELKDKVIKGELDNLKLSKGGKNLENTNLVEATTALQVLGYNKRQIDEVVVNLEIKNDSVEDIIKKVLKHMQNI